MTPESSTDTAHAVSHQVMWNRLISVVEEQAQALVRTAFSTSVREAGDLSAGVYDVKGQMLAQAVTGTPGHVNAMAESVGHFIREIGREAMFEGDVYITNDPWMGTGHLHDITVVTPSFHRGALVGFFACTAHIVDIGGRGFGADANSVYEEGLRIPIMKFAERGSVDTSFIRIVRANVREADQVVGDMYALATCNDIGHRRLIDMLTEFGLVDLTSIAEFILDNSLRATLHRIAALPQATAHNAMTIDGFDTPIRIQVQLDIGSDHVAADFSGTSPVDRKGINVPLVYTKAYACYALKCAIAPDIPNNAASLAPFRISAPEGTIVNAVHPAPVALRHIIGHMIPDVVLGALHDILPDTVPTEGAGALCNFQVSLRPRSDGNRPGTGRRAEVLMFNSGGSGARPTSDGLNATAFPSGVMTMPIEATEQTGPVIIWRKELRPDSGGTGAHRGGLGQFMEVGAADGYEFDFSAMLDRVDHPARGRDGGGAGGATEIGLDDGTPLRGKGRQAIPAGRRVMLAFPGGGGLGAPRERDRAAVRRDLRREYISEQAAREIYGLSDADIARAQGAGKDPDDGA
ncbi:MAG: hydantoinase B/oxoprolinase family protein [Pseudomonadota bacterium]